MREDTLRSLLEDIREGRLSVENGLDRLKELPYKDLGHAKIDSHREIRVGCPEVIFCQGKTVKQIVEIVRFMLTLDTNILATRATEEIYHAVREICADAHYHPEARALVIRKIEIPKPESYVAIVSAGTSDLPVAYEAAVTCELLGNRVEMINDVGIAGIHRLFDHLKAIRGAKVVVAVAGMEGALASVVGGLVDKPVIAVPTSVGYGASFHGLAALLAMLNSCAPGVCVVNIDNGFGAGYLASIINRLNA